MSYLRNATIMMKNPPKNCNSKQQNQYLPQKFYLLITMFLVFQTVTLVNTTGFQNSSLSPTNMLIIIVQKKLKLEFVELCVPLEIDHVV